MYSKKEYTILLYFQIQISAKQHVFNNKKLALHVCHNFWNNLVIFEDSNFIKPQINNVVVMEFKAGYRSASTANICHAIRRIKISQSRMINHHLFISSKEHYLEQYHQ